MDLGCVEFTQWIFQDHSNVCLFASAPSFYFLFSVCIHHWQFIFLSLSPSFFISFSPLSSSFSPECNKQYKHPCQSRLAFAFTLVYHFDILALFLFSFGYRFLFYLSISRVTMRMTPRDFILTKLRVYFPFFHFSSE